MKLLDSWKLRWVVWVWNHTPNCPGMSRLASLSLEQPASFALRLKMRLHHLICVWCQRYQKQLQFLHRAAPRMQEEIEAASIGNCQRNPSAAWWSDCARSAGIEVSSRIL